MSDAIQSDQNLFALFWSQYYPLRLQGRSAAGTHQHEITLRHFGRFLGRDPTTADLTDETVTAFMGWLAEQCAVITAVKCIDKLLAQWRFLSHRGIVDRWPEIRKLKAPERIPTAWTPEQVKRLLDACGKVPGKIAGINAAHWWVALHHVLYDTGERIGAVMQLEWTHVDLKACWLTFKAETRKGSTRDRAFRLHKDTAVALGRIIDPKRDLVFPWHRDPKQLWPEYTLILSVAGLPCDRLSKFHRMRRTVATFVQAAGGNATEVLDHSDPKVTRSYLDPRQLDRQYPSDLLPRPENLSSKTGIPRHEPQKNGHSNGHRNGRLSTLPLGESLLTYFAKEFVATLQGHTESAQRNYNCAVAKFKDFAECDPLLSAITPSVIEEFKAWCAAQNMTVEARTKYANRIMAIVRHKHPDRFPIKRRGLAKGGDNA